MNPEKMILTPQKVFKDNDAIGFFTKEEFKAYISSLKPYERDDVRNMVSAINSNQTAPIISIYKGKEGAKFFIVRTSYYSMLAPYKVPYFKGFENLLSHGKLFDIQLSLDEMIKEADK